MEMPDPLADPWHAALLQAWEGFCAGTTPVGAVVVSPAGKVVATGRGRRHDSSGPSGQLANAHVAHAEINALAQLDAGRHWEDHTLLTTLEPCAMCHGAAIQAAIGALSFAAPDPYAGTAMHRFESPQSRRRSLRILGPRGDVVGTFSTLMHVAWLAERGAGHVVSAYEDALPELTAYALSTRRDLFLAATRGDYPAALELAWSAPQPP